MTSSLLTDCSPMRWSFHELEWGQRTQVMGIVNVTPDFFLVMACNLMAIGCNVLWLKQSALWLKARC